ncbi:hypothetical protein ACOME3_005923 [Neoechinorhynchus agilis]
MSRRYSSEEYNKSSSGRRHNSRSPDDRTTATRRRRNPRSPPLHIDNLVSLKVDNISYSTRVDELRKAFCGFGEIGDVYLPRNHVTHESLGYAFVRFTKRDDAMCAMKEMDGFRLDGRQLGVHLARYGRNTSAGVGRKRSHRNGRKRSSSINRYDDTRRRQHRSRSYSPWRTKQQRDRPSDQRSNQSYER